VAGFMLEGWDNQKIFDCVKENQLDGRFKTPASTEFLYKVGYRLRTEGVLEKIERDKKEKKTVEDENEVKVDIPGSEVTPPRTPEKEDLPFLQREENDPPGSVRARAQKYVTHV